MSNREINEKKVNVHVVGVSPSDKKKLIQFIDSKNVLIDETEKDIKCDKGYVVVYSDNSDIEEIIRDRIKKNLDKITTGNYDIKNIDYKTVTQNRDKTIKKYKKYEHIKFDDLFRKFNENTVENLYTVSSKLYDKTFSIKEYKKNVNRLELGELVNSKVYGYTSEWMALLSLIKDGKKCFRKGEMNGKPFIEEIVKDGFKILNSSGYLYKIPFKNCVKKGYKYEIIDDVEILNTIEVKNVLEYLYDSGVKFYEYKSQ